jgi:hypothetical protein
MVEDRHKELRDKIDAAARQTGELIIEAYAGRIAMAQKYGNFSRAAELSRMAAEDISRANEPLARALALLPPPPFVIKVPK